MENQPTNPPDNNLVWAILSTVLCCMPLGIVAIIKSSNVNTLWAQGNYEGAQKAANDAKKFSIWAAVVQVILIALIIIFYVVIFAGLVFSEL